MHRDKPLLLSAGASNFNHPNMTHCKLKHGRTVYCERFHISLFWLQKAKERMSTSGLRPSQLIPLKAALLQVAWDANIIAPMTSHFFNFVNTIYCISFTVGILTHYKQSSLRWVRSQRPKLALDYSLDWTLIVGFWWTEAASSGTCWLPTCIRRRLKNHHHVNQPCPLKPCEVLE